MTSPLDIRDLVIFLEGLMQNNNKVWFEAHRPEYDRLRRQFLDMLDSIISQSASSFAPEFADIDPKRCLFSIYRDTRFSSDKSPYKTNFGALIPIRSGEAVCAGYYIHIDGNGKLMSGACVRTLPSAELTRVRDYIAKNHTELISIVNQATSDGLTVFGGERQKTVPRGFSPDHPASEYLKLKSFKLLTVEPSTKIKGNLTSHIVDVLRCSQPFADYIRRMLA